jgi:signal transduction histidine kinase/YHS domain-containing protein
MKRRKRWQQRDAHIEPLRELQRRAEAMTRGDFSSLGQPVGGSGEVEDLRRAMDVMGAHVEQAQIGMQDYIAALTTAQEAERGRLARELHDDTVQRLVALGQGVERVQRVLERDPALALERLKGLRAEITSMVQAVRTMIGDLRPPALEELGLIPAVELLLTRQSDELPRVAVQVYGTKRRLDPQSELALFRIIQEAWSNIRRHAQAQHAIFSFTYGPDMLDVVIMDDGCGFLPPGNARSEGRGQRGTFGLLGMQERATLVGGALEINSAPGQSTQLHIHIPYPGVDGRDPICNMIVGPEALSATYNEQIYRFCSPACRDLFMAQPERYIQHP